MTNKVQYSKKFPDGTILVIGGDTVEEFEELYTKFRKTDVAKNIFSEAKPRVATETKQVATSTAAPDGEEYGVSLPPDAMLDIVRKKGQVYGEISPFPGTKYPVKIWPEVMETIDGYGDDVWELSLGGRNVVYIKNEKGYPLKVVRVA